jgi:hypothetical protein
LAVKEGTKLGIPRVWVRMQRRSFFGKEWSIGYFPLATSCTHLHMRKRPVCACRDACCKGYFSHSSRTGVGIFVCFGCFSFSCCDRSFGEGCLWLVVVEMGLVCMLVRRIGASKTWMSAIADGGCSHIPQFASLVS